MWFLSAKKARQQLEAERGRKEGEEPRRKYQFFDTFWMEICKAEHTPFPFRSLFGLI